MYRMKIKLLCMRYQSAVIVVFFYSHGMSKKQRVSLSLHWCGYVSFFRGMACLFIPLDLKKENLHIYACDHWVLF